MSDNRKQLIVCKGDGAAQYVADELLRIARTDPSRFVATVERMVTTRRSKRKLNDLADVLHEMRCLVESRMDWRVSYPSRIVVDKWAKRIAAVMEVTKRKGSEDDERATHRG